MSNLTKRATIYFEPNLHRFLKLKAAETAKSISEIINELIKKELLEDAEDISDYKLRINEPTIPYEKLIKDLKKNGRI